MATGWRLGSRTRRSSREAPSALTPTRWSAASAAAAPGRSRRSRDTETQSRINSRTASLALSGAFGAHGDDIVGRINASSAEVLDAIRAHGDSVADRLSDAAASGQQRHRRPFGRRREPRFLNQRRGRANPHNPCRCPRVAAVGGRRHRQRAWRCGRRPACRRVGSDQRRRSRLRRRGRKPRRRKRSADRRCDPRSRRFCRRPTRPGLGGDAQRRRRLCR